MVRLAVMCLATALALLVGCAKEAETTYEPPNMKQVQEPITEHGPEGVQKRLEAAASYLLTYVKEVGKFPEARTGFELRDSLKQYFGDRLAQLDKQGDPLTQFDLAWGRHDGKGPILYNNSLAGRSLSEIRDPKGTWLLRDPIQIVDKGYAEVSVDGKSKIIVLSDEPALGGMGRIGGGGG
jgi:hypothetical protein